MKSGQEVYISNEFWEVLPTDVVIESLDKSFKIRMQIKSQLGKTKWINLSIDQFREIECILANWENNHG